MDKPLLDPRDILSGLAASVVDDSEAFHLLWDAMGYLEAKRAPNPEWKWPFCGWCKAGVPLNGTGQLHRVRWHPDFWQPCTAPAPDEYIATLRAQLADTANRVTALENALAILRSEQIGEHEWGIKCIEDHNSIIDDALSGRELADHPDTRRVRVLIAWLNKCGQFWRFIESTHPRLRTSREQATPEEWTAAIDLAMRPDEAEAVKPQTFAEGYPVYTCRHCGKDFERHHDDKCPEAVKEDANAE